MISRNMRLNKMNNIKQMKICLNCIHLKFKDKNKHGWPEIGCESMLFQGTGITIEILRNLAKIETICENFKPVKE